MCSMFVSWLIATWFYLPFEHFVGSRGISARKNVGITTIRWWTNCVRWYRQEIVKWINPVCCWRQLHFCENTTVHHFALMFKVMSMPLRLWYRTKKKKWKKCWHLLIKLYCLLWLICWPLCGDHERQSSLRLREWCRSDGQIEGTRNSGGVETIVSVEWRIYAAGSGGFGRFYHHFFVGRAHLSCIGSDCVAYGAFAGTNTNILQIRRMFIL